LRLLIKKIDADGRLSLLPQYLETPWEFEIVDPGDHAGFSRSLERADAMVSMSWKWDAPAAQHLRLLQLPGAGTDEIDFQRLGNRTTVCNCYEHEIGIAEYVLASMLAWTVPIQRMDRDLRHGRWAGSYLCGPQHGELFDKTVGVIGYGHIGQEVARRAKAFGMRVLCCTRTPRKPDGYADRIDDMAHFVQMLGESDFVVITTPLTERTRGLFDRHAFSAMRPTSVLINVARAAIADEAELFSALKEGRIGGAVLDVWYRYPEQGQVDGPSPSAFPFRELDNVIMTPHGSAWTEGLIKRRNRVIAGNLDRLARGEALVNVVRAPVDSIRE
jgi:phosphoglycerate dehydrogenase-like enzyme